MDICTTYQHPSLQGMLDPELPYSGSTACGTAWQLLISIFFPFFCQRPVSCVSNHLQACAFKRRHTWTAHCSKACGAPYKRSFRTYESLTAGLPRPTSNRRRGVHRLDEDALSKSRGRIIRLCGNAPHSLTSPGHSRPAFQQAHTC